MSEKVNTLVPMGYGEFMKRRAPFASAANARREERRNHGDDSPWFVCVLEEIAMGLMQENDSLRKQVDEVERRMAVTQQSLIDLAAAVGYTDGLVSKKGK